MAEVAPEPALGVSWREALAVFDRDLSATGAAEATRRAYGTDLDRLARWAESRQMEPAGVGFARFSLASFSMPETNASESPVTSSA